MGTNKLTKSRAINSPASAESGGSNSGSVIGSRKKTSTSGGNASASSNVKVSPRSETHPTTSNTNGPSPPAAPLPLPPAATPTCNRPFLIDNVPPADLAPLPQKRMTSVRNTLNRVKSSSTKPKKPSPLAKTISASSIGSVGGGPDKGSGVEGKGHVDGVLTALEQFTLHNALVAQQLQGGWTAFVPSSGLSESSPASKATGFASDLNRKNSQTRNNKREHRRLPSVSVPSSGFGGLGYHQLLSDLSPDETLALLLHSEGQPSCEDALASLLSEAGVCLDAPILNSSDSRVGLDRGHPYPYPHIDPIPPSPPTRVKPLGRYASADERRAYVRARTSECASLTPEMLMRDDGQIVWSDFASEEELEVEDVYSYHDYGRKDEKRRLRRSERRRAGIRKSLVWTPHTEQEDDGFPKMGTEDWKTWMEKNDVASRALNERRLNEGFQDRGRNIYSVS